MPTITEKNLTFIFPDIWLVNKYDEQNFYRHRIQKCQATAAVDILALSETELFLIEVKDFRTHRIENKQRIQHAELADDFAQKVRDTIAGLYGAYRNHASILEPFYKYLFANPKDIKEKRDKRKITAILFLEEDTPPIKRRNLKIAHRYLRENMEMRLKFLQVRCHVYNKKTLPKKFGWQVTG
jgi:hypothetical protein